MKVLIWGMGSLGRAAAEVCSQVPRSDLVGVVTARPVEVQSLFPSVSMFDDLDSAASAHPDAFVLHTGHALADELADKLADCARRGLDVVTSSGLFHPASQLADAGAALNALAKERGTRIVTAGAHPGFVFDLLPGLLFDLAPGWTSATVAKPSDARSWPLGTLHLQGIGRPAQELEHEIPYPMAASGHLFAAAVGARVTALRERRLAEVAPTDVSTHGETVPAGWAVGFRQECELELEEGRRLTLVWAPTIRVADDLDLRLHIDVRGSSWLRMELDGSFRDNPYPATAQRMLHVASACRRLSPGLHQITDVGAGWC